MMWEACAEKMQGDGRRDRNGLPGNGCAYDDADGDVDVQYQRSATETNITRSRARDFLGADARTGLRIRPAGFRNATRARPKA